MQKISLRFSMIGRCMFFMLSLFSFQAISQTDSSNQFMSCGANAAFFLTCGSSPDSGTYPAPLSPFSSAAIISCDKIDFYYEDINRGFYTGFNDTTHVGGITLGEIRRNSLCAAAHYLQSVIDFSYVPTSNHIRIYVDTSYSHTFHTYPHNIGNFLAFAAPFYDTTVNGITNGWVNDFVNSSTGTDPAPGKFHGKILVNFDKTFDLVGFGIIIDSPFVPWHNDYSAPFISSTSCGQLDLFSVLLHELCHTLGWLSLVHYDPNGSAVGQAPTPTITSHHIFSGLDWSMRVCDNTYPLSLANRLISGTRTAPYIDPAMATTTLLNFSNYWLNDSAAPKNIPVYSGAVISPLIASYLSHLDQQPFAYTLRQRISPGDQQTYVMGPGFPSGALRRYFSKGEIQSFVDILGYRLTTGYLAATPNIYPNHTPFSNKMAQYGITQSNYGYFTETVTPDDTLTNNVGISRTVVSISNMVSSGEITDADPGDAANVYIDSSTLVNFRGCGINGNNHASLQVSSDAKKIIYTPRANFYGRAQFGFNITDGKETGSFIVMTIDVKKGTNVSSAVGTNLVCNGGFEEGSEVKIRVIGENIPNSIITEQGQKENEWQGICFSDSHPYCFHANNKGSHLYASSGMTVRRSNYGFNYSYLDTCGVLDTSTSEVGTEWLSFPNTPGSTSGFSMDFPNSFGGTGDRYQTFSSPGGSYYYLTDSLKHCSRYILQFDVYKTFMDGDPDVQFEIGFADHTVNLGTTLPEPSFNFEFRDTVNPSISTWTHITDTFWYCGATPSNILYIAHSGIGGSFSQLHIDNLSLKKDTVQPPPLLVSITSDSISACQTQLTANVTNGACTKSYVWNATARTSVTSKYDTVATNATAIYTVTVNDGCRSKSATISTTFTPLPAITGPSTVCTGFSRLLSDAVTGGSWSSSNTAVATTFTFPGADGFVYSVASGTATISYTDLCGRTVTKNITVNPNPAAITGAAPVCAYSTITLSDATTGGTWSGGYVTANVNSTSGIVTGLFPGTTTITYTITSTGCYSSTIVTVNTTPLSITGNTHVCFGTGLTLHDPTTGGVWTSANTLVATVATDTGIINEVSAGTSTISYTMPVTGCGTSIVVTINVVPDLITGPLSVCPTGTITLTDAITSGYWTSSNTSIATVVNLGAGIGVFVGAAYGFDTINYITLAGCTTMTIVTVEPIPVITGSSSVCVGSNIILADILTGGTWATTTGSIASINVTSGIVTGISPGTVTIYYRISATTCATTKVITVYGLPPGITGNTPVCVGSSITVQDATTGGAWSSANTGIATAGTSTGVITGAATGTTTISYTLASTGCSISTIATVNPLPSAIAGSASVCVGSTIALSDPGGGTWISGTTSIATINASGVVTGVTAGTSIITYTLPTGCQITKTITVNPIPPGITGLNYLCEGSAVTLSDATTGGTWSSNNTAIASVVSGIVTGVSGTATATITYTAPTGCITTTTITVYSTTDPCSPCTILGTLGDFIPIGTSGTISGTLGTGYYYIPGDVTITGSVNMTDAKVFVAPTAHIYVAPSAALTLNGCHLFCCSIGMWEGIVVQSDATQTGTIVMQGDGSSGLYGNSTLIEDAMTAVAIDSPKLPTGGSATFITTRNTIFNKNYTGILVTNALVSPSITTTITSNQFDIENTIFTCRRLSGSFATWPDVPTLKTEVSSPTPYLSPYTVDTYTPAACNGYANRLKVGIDLANVGTGTLTFSAIQLGAPNTSNMTMFGSYNYQQNLFDDLNVGIRGSNANLNSTNNAFSNLYPWTTAIFPGDHGGEGIYVGNTDHYRYAVNVQAGTYSSGTFGYTTTSPNYFYDCKIGVYVNNYALTTGTGSYMINSKDNTACCSGAHFLGNSIYGYKVLTTVNQNVDISNNIIVNVDYGVSVQIPTPRGPFAHPLVTPSPIMVNGNAINAKAPGIKDAGRHYVEFPIWIDVPLSLITPFGSLPSTAQINTDNNGIDDAYNGIYINGANWQRSTSASNTINAIEYPGGANKGWSQFGVYHGNCVNDDVVSNTITGTDYTDTMWRAVQLMHGMTHRVNCNTVSTMGVGFEFTGTSISSTWLSNKMYNSSYGLMLGGIIGPQGSTSQLSYNEWDAVSGTGFSWSGFHQTYTKNGIYPTSSPLYLVAGASVDPQYNNASASYITTAAKCAHTYGCDVSTLMTSGTGNGLNVLPGGSGWPFDLSCYTINQISRVAMERMVRQNLSYSTYPNLNYWMGQYAVWEAMQQDSTLADSSTILTAFSLMANNSRFSLFTNIEDAIDTGDISTAQDLLDAFGVDSLNNTQGDTTSGVQMADDTTADNIVLNYRQYYQLYINYLDSALSGSDSMAIEAMAELCPITDGAVVFKARALYDIVFDTLRFFPDMCGDSVIFDSSAMRQSHNTEVNMTSAENQKYMLYPSPNDGNFVLEQQVFDAKPVLIEIYDVVGRIIYKDNLIFTSPAKKINISNIASGLYLMHVADDKRQMFNFKFVVE